MADDMKSQNAASSTPRPQKSHEDRIETLKHQVREMAAAAGQSTIDDIDRRREPLLAQARTEAEDRAETQIDSTQQQLEKQHDRELQNARLEARATIARFRWSELERVLIEAERQVATLERDDGPRYLDALYRFFSDGVDRIEGNQFTVTGSDKQISALMENPKISDLDVRFVQDPAGGGLRIATPDGNVVVDHSISQRLEHLEEGLRVTVLERLFGLGSDLEVEPS